MNKKDPETQFWKEVEKSSKSLIADLLEKTLPLSATPQVFDLEKDTDYRILLRDDLPNYYSEQEEYQAKIANDNWTSADVEEVAQDLTCTYFDLVVQALVVGLTRYPAFANTNLAQTFMN